MAGEAESGVIRSQSKGRLLSLEGGRGKEWIRPELSEEVWPYRRLDLGLVQNHERTHFSCF